MGNRCVALGRVKNFGYLVRKATSVGIIMEEMVNTQWRSGYFFNIVKGIFWNWSK